MTRRYLATTFFIAVAGALAIAACSTDDGGGARRGYGASSKPAAGDAADRLGDDVLAVIDTLPDSPTLRVRCKGSWRAGGRERAPARARRRQP